MSVAKVRDSGKLRLEPLNGSLAAIIFEGECPTSGWLLITEPDILRASSHIFIPAAPCDVVESFVINDLSECLRLGCRYTIDDDDLEFNLLDGRPLRFVNEETTDTTELTPTRTTEAERR